MVHSPMPSILLHRCHSFNLCVQLSKSFQIMRVGSLKPGSQTGQLVKVMQGQDWVNTDYQQMASLLSRGLKDKGEKLFSL